MTSLKLSAKGLNHFLNYEKDFIFILNQKQIKTSKYIAIFLSPKISDLFSSDPSLSHFIISPSFRITDDHIQLFTNFINCRNIDINQQNVHFLMEIGKSLNNSEIIQQATNFLLNSENININNCIKRFKLKFETSINSEEEEKYIANHFEEIQENNYKICNIKMLETILQREDFKISNEDEIINKIKNIGKEYWNLLKYIRIENLTISGMKNYFEMIKEEELFNDINIFNNIYEIMIKMKEEIEENHKHKKNDSNNSEEFKYTKGKELEGIL